MSGREWRPLTPAEQGGAGSDARKVLEVIAAAMGRADQWATIERVEGRTTMLVTHPDKGHPDMLRIEVTEWYALESPQTEEHHHHGK